MTCSSGKVQHLTRERAQQAIRRLRQQRDDGSPARKPMMIYRCDECGYLHIGHRPAWWRLVEMRREGRAEA